MRTIARMPSPFSLGRDRTIVADRKLDQRTPGAAAMTRCRGRCAVLAWVLGASASVALAASDAPAQPAGGRPLTLQQAESLLDRGNPELQLARVALRAAQAEVVVAGQPPNPNLSLNAASISAADGLGGGYPWDKRVDSVIRIEQQVERGGKRRLRIDAAGFSAAAAERDLAETARQQRLMLHAAYYDLLLAQHKERISLDAVDLCERSMAEVRAAQGPGAADYVRLDIDRLRALNDARQARADAERARATLAYLIGMEPEVSDLRATGPWPALAERPSGPSLDVVLSRRHDFAAALARQQAAERGRELARAQRVRDLTVGVQLQRYPFVDGTSVGVGVAFPLFTRHYFEGELQRAEAGAQAAALNVQRTRGFVAAELARTSAELDSAIERARRYDDVLLHEAQRAAIAAEMAYRGGELGVMDLLDARRNLYAARVDAAVAHSEHAKARAVWQAASLAYESE